MYYHFRLRRQARSQAQAEGRWLLVNIQSHEQFASHMLNRDTWVHETMESVLRTTFLLWQRGHTSEQGAAYMRMHRLAEDDLPHIGVIDPRTGAKLLTLTVNFQSFLWVLVVVILHFAGLIFLFFRVAGLRLSG